MLMIPLYIPEVKHSEGGTGWAEMIRIGYEMEASGWETLGVEGRSPLTPSKIMEIPVFGGGRREITIDFNNSNSHNLYFVEPLTPR